MSKLFWILRHFESMCATFDRSVFVDLHNGDPSDIQGFFIKDPDLLSWVYNNQDNLLFSQNYYVLEHGSNVILKIFESQHEADAYIEHQKALDVQKELSEKLHEEISDAPTRKRKM